MALSCQGRYKPACLSPMPPRMKTSASYLRSLLAIYKSPTGRSNSTEGNGRIEQLPVADFWHQHKKNNGTKDSANGDINSSRVRPKSSPPISTYSVPLHSRHTPGLILRQSHQPDCPKQEIKCMQHLVHLKIHHNAQTSKDCQVWIHRITRRLKTTYFTINLIIYIKRWTQLNIKRTQF